MTSNTAPDHNATRPSGTMFNGALRKKAFTSAKSEECIHYSSVSKGSHMRRWRCKSAHWLIIGATIITGGVGGSMSGILEYSSCHNSPRRTVGEENDILLIVLPTSFQRTERHCTLLHCYSNKVSVVLWWHHIACPTAGVSAYTSVNLFHTRVTILNCACRY